MDRPLFVSYRIEERSYVSFVKREIHNLVRPVFSEIRTGEIDIVVSELTSNLIKHAGSGELLYRLSQEEGGHVLELLCIDNGPGMKDVEHFMRDGISTTNTLGHGIGSIMRLSNVAQVYSLQDWGTVIYTALYNDPEYKAPKNRLLLRCLNVCKPGEMVSGDGYDYRLTDDGALIFVGDGLGHGPNAKEAVDTAKRYLDDNGELDPAAIIKGMDKSMKKTRGMVASLAFLNYEEKKWQLCGVGNINTRMQRGLEYRNYIANNGIIGLTTPSRLESYSIDMEKFQQLILCSDGITTRWDIFKYPAILKYDPMVLAGAIYKDHARQNDDMTILIAKLV